MQAQTQALPHIEGHQFNAQLLQTVGQKASFGPLTIDYSVDLSVPQITVEVELFGVSIGGGTINATNPTITLGGGAMGAKAEVSLTADFNARKVSYNVTVSLPFVGTKNWSGVLFSW